MCVEWAFRGVGTWGRRFSLTKREVFKDRNSQRVVALKPSKQGTRRVSSEKREERNVLIRPRALDRCTLWMGTTQTRLKEGIIASTRRLCVCVCGC